MDVFKVGDIVARKSYGGDVFFKIVDIRFGEEGRPTYVLKGLSYRISADSAQEDLVRQNPINAFINTQRDMARARSRISAGGFAARLLQHRVRGRPGRVLHIDSSSSFLKTCLDHYRQDGVRAVGILADESEQPQIVRRALERYSPDILVLTGHDSIKKNAASPNSIESYSNSKYFIQGVKEARKYQPDLDKLCIFAGACQSYFEAIMGAGANFASSPGRILINALDPEIVCEKVALTDSRSIVTPRQVAEIVISGSRGISGVNTKGRLVRI